MNICFLNYRKRLSFQNQIKLVAPKSADLYKWTPWKFTICLRPWNNVLLSVCILQPVHLQSALCTLSQFALCRTFPRYKVNVPMLLLWFAPCLGHFTKLYNWLNWIFHLCHGEIIQLKTMLCFKIFQFFTLLLELTKIFYRYKCLDWDSSKISACRVVT